MNVFYLQNENGLNIQKVWKTALYNMQHYGTLVLIRCQGTNVAVLFPECQNAQYYWPFSAFHMHVSRTIDGLPWLRFLAFYDVNIHPINMYIHYRDKLALRLRLVFANENLQLLCQLGVYIWDIWKCSWSENLLTPVTLMSDREIFLMANE